MTLAELVADRSMLCTNCGAKGSCAVAVPTEDPYVGRVICLACRSTWLAVVPMFQRDAVRP